MPGITEASSATGWVHQEKRNYYN